MAHNTHQSIANLAGDPPMFSGHFRHVLDEKHRITIPSCWRRNHSDEFYLVPDQSNLYLLAMPPAEFQKVGDQVNAHAEISPQERRIFIRQFYSRAHNCSADKQGRLLLPDDHRKQVGLQEEVVLVGSSARFEIWNPAQWKQFQETGMPVYRKVSDLIGL